MNSADDGMRNLAEYALNLSRNDVASAIKFLCDLSMTFTEACSAIEAVVGLDETQPPQCGNSGEGTL